MRSETIMKRIFWVATAILIAATTTVISQPQLDKAKDLMKQKKYGEAIAACQIYLQSSSRDENGWLVLAKAYQQMQNLDSAEIAAKKAVQLDDEMMEGYTTTRTNSTCKEKCSRCLCNSKGRVENDETKGSPNILLCLLYWDKV